LRLHIVDTASFGGAITSSGAKIGSGTGYVSSSDGVYSTKGGSAVMADIGAAPVVRTINISSANENITATGGGNLSANRTLQVTMSAVPSFTGVTASTGFTGSGYVRVGGDIRGTQITASVGVQTPTILVTSVTTASNLSVGNSTKVNNYPVVGMASGSLLVYNGTNITASVHTGDDFYGSWMSHAQCLARISLRI